MTGTDFICLTPFLIIALAPVIIMLTIAFKRHYEVIYGFSLTAYLIAFISVFFISRFVPHLITPLFIIDNFSLFIIGIITVSGIFLTVLSHDYLIQQLGEKEEYFIILFIASLGASVLAASNHIVSFFLGLETLSISLYILIAYKRQYNYSIEAGMKYLILASVSSAILLFGMALVYTGTGKMGFNEIAFAIITSGGTTPLILAGFGMILVGIGFKLALVPFHMWTPDVYQGAPAPVSAFVASVSKGAVMAVLIRFFYIANGFQLHALVIIISVIAIFSMFTGNFLALRQQNIKRLLAYSSIANLGYLLVPLLIGGKNGIQSAIFYLISYFIATIGAFGIVSLLSVCGQDAEDITNYKGLFWKKPWIAVVLTLIMLSLAGIPITAGFIAKFYIVIEGLRTNLWILVISLIINSIISLYYYLRVITTMFSESGDEKIPVVSLSGNIVLGLIAAGILWLGIQPGWLLNIINRISGLN